MFSSLKSLIEAPNVPIIMYPTEVSFAVKVINDLFSRGLYKINVTSAGVDPVEIECLITAEVCVVLNLRPSTSYNVSAVICPPGIGQCSAPTKTVIARTAPPGMFQHERKYFYIIMI